MDIINVQLIVTLSLWQLLLSLALASAYFQNAESNFEMQSPAQKALVPQKSCVNPGIRGSSHLNEMEKWEEGSNHRRLKWSSTYRKWGCEMYGALSCGHGLQSEFIFHPFPQISEVIWFKSFASPSSFSPGHVPHPLLSEGHRILFKAQVLQRS